MNVRAGTGMSSAQRAEDAGREAAEAAVGALKGEPPALVIVYTTSRYDLSALLSAIRSVTAPALLIGATSSGEFAQGRYMGRGEGVGVLALTAGPYRFTAASAACIGADLGLAGQDIARECKNAAGMSPNATVLLLADPLQGDLQKLVRGIYHVTGPRVPIVGGSADYERNVQKTFVFHDGTVVPEGAVALWISSELPLHVVTRHGWKPVGAPLLVTRAEGTEIVEISGRPAALVYEERIGLVPGQTPVEQYTYLSMLHPLGLLQHDGSTVIRVARARTERGTLIVHGCVPPVGSALQVMESTVDGLLDIVEDVVRTALAAHPQPGVLLAFSCTARAIMLGDRAADEPRRLQAAAGGVPTFGFHTGGEFARTAGVLATHNATLTTLAL